MLRGRPASPSICVLQASVCPQLPSLRQGRRHIGRGSFEKVNGVIKIARIRTISIAVRQHGIPAESLVTCVDLSQRQDCSRPPEFPHPLTQSLVARIIFVIRTKCEKTLPMVVLRSSPGTSRIQIVPIIRLARMSKLSG